jgi:hypothetical protein
LKFNAIGMENREKTAMAEPDEVKFLAVLLE